MRPPAQEAGSEPVWIITLIRDPALACSKEDSSASVGSPSVKGLRRSGSLRANGRPPSATSEMAQGLPIAAVAPLTLLEHFGVHHVSGIVTHVKRLASVDIQILAGNEAAKP